MNSQLFVAACVTLGSLGAWNTWTLYQVNTRLDAIEAQEASLIKQTISSAQDDPTRSRSAINTQKKSPKGVETSPKRYAPAASPQQEASSAEAAIDLSNPDIREAIAKIAQDNAQQKETQRRKSKMEAYKTSLQHELEKFSLEKEYDPDTVERIEAILDESTNEWTAIRQQVREGEISWLDARTEFKAIGDETESKATEHISEEDYKELRSRLWGQWGQ